MRSGKRGSWATARALVGSALLLVGVSGCGEDPPPPLPGEEIFATMQGALPLDFVMEQFPDGGVVRPADMAESSVIHGYWVDQYLVDGQIVDIVWIHDPALGYPESGDLRTQVNPVIFRNQQMDGWGWEHLDQRTEEWDIVDRSKGGLGGMPSAPEPADTTAAAGDSTIAAAVGESGEEDSESFSF